MLAAIAATVAAAAAVAVYLTQGRQPVGPGAVPTATRPANNGEPAAANAAPEPAPNAAATATAPVVGSAEPALAASVAAPSASAAAPGDVNGCAIATLPEGTVGDAPEIGFLCTGTDLWGLTRKVNQQVLHHGAPPGMIRWAHLGRFDLAAVALLRRRCCPGANAVTAATPKGLCESLSSSIEAVAGDASGANVDRYAADVDCIVSHGIRYPSEWWDRVGAKDARGQFEQFLSELRAPQKN